MNPAGTATLVLSILAAALSAQAQYDLIHLGSAAGDYGLDIAVAGHYAFLASYTGGLRVYDISDPRTPIFVAATNSGIPYVYDRNITIAGDFAYTGADRDTNFHVYNISAPTRPVPVAKIFSGNYVSQIAVTGTVGYVANTAEGFSVYDFSNPSMPTQVTNFAGTRATCVTVQGGYAYVGSEHMFQIFSLTKPFAPVEVGKTTSLYSAAIAVSEGYAFVACPQVGVTLFDVRNPLSPLQVGPVLSIGRVYDVLISAHYLFVANLSAGVSV